MKNNLTIHAILLLLNCSRTMSYAQSTNQNANIQQLDTLKYLRENIASKKPQLSHKPLGTILKELNLTVKSYLVNVSANNKKPPYLTLYFEDAKRVSENFSNKKTVPLVMVFFDDVIPQKEA